MLVIRLQRTGRKNQPSYRVIVSPKGRGGPKGKPVEYLGWFNPLKKTLEFKKERILYWLSQGAKTSATLHNLLIKLGIITGKKIAVHQTPAPKEQTREASVSAPVKAESAPVSEPALQTPAEPSLEPVSEPAPEAAAPAQPSGESAPSEKAV
jgi:small subunit ribosomal protein S16